MPLLYLWVCEIAGAVMSPTWEWPALTSLSGSLEFQSRYRPLSKSLLPRLVHIPNTHVYILDPGFCHMCVEKALRHLKEPAQPPLSVSSIHFHPMHCISNTFFFAKTPAIKKGHFSAGTKSQRPLFSPMSQFPHLMPNQIYIIRMSGRAGLKEFLSGTTN